MVARTCPDPLPQLLQRFFVVVVTGFHTNGWLPKPFEKLFPSFGKLDHRAIFIHSSDKFLSASHYAKNHQHRDINTTTILQERPAFSLSSLKPEETSASQNYHSRLSVTPRKNTGTLNTLPLRLRSSQAMVKENSRKETFSNYMDASVPHKRTAGILQQRDVISLSNVSDIHKLENKQYYRWSKNQDDNFTICRKLTPINNNLTQSYSADHEENHPIDEEGSQPSQKLPLQNIATSRPFKILPSLYSNLNANYKNTKLSPENGKHQATSTCPKNVKTPSQKSRSPDIPNILGFQVTRLRKCLAVYPSPDQKELPRKKPNKRLFMVYVVHLSHQETYQDAPLYDNKAQVLVKRNGSTA
ncbi:nitric oxide-inducible protein [Cricetulus griseus]|uniref:Nitric oxide-inducible protein n=1 Tax=Cricetulus griseus TaxID=10029 RepID=A0A061IFC7_CRIGR|nr:nitric oxide-inducible protein [Cricetulus griseus]